jgi:molybdate transport system permease protein
VVAAAGALLFLLPLAGLVVRAPWSSLLAELGAPRVRTAFALSLLSSIAATALSLVLGLSLAWAQARMRFPGRSILRALTTLPVVLPPVVGGVALLLAFGRRGIAGALLYRAFGLSLPFTLGAAILAQTFVAMPFLVLVIEGGLQSMDSRLEDAARSLGARRWTTFRRVTLPAIRPALMAGGVLCWARALGEFGATITFAGSFPGRTQTLPLAVYAALETNLDSAVALSLVLVAFSGAVLIALRGRWLGRL